MEKAARKTSADPVQEKLRKDKDMWNKQVSQFIESVKQVKKTMNGYPSKLNPQKGNIKNPLPTSVPSTLEALTQSFDQIAQSGEAIVEEQLAYSKNRRKTQPKAPKAPEAPGLTITPGTPEPAPDLTKQLTAWEEKYGLVAEASNPVSRFFAKLLNPSFGFGEAARIRRVRMQLLKACADTYKKLGKLQVDVVKSSKNSIETSNNLMHEAWRSWETVRTGFNTYKNMMPAKVPDAGGLIEEPKEVTKDKEKGHEQAVESTEKVEQQMERVDRAVEEGKPEPGDADYEPEPGQDPKSSGKGPDWIGGRERMIEDLHKQELLDLAKRAGKDFQFALNNFWFMQNHDVDLSIFHELEQYKKEYHIRDEWAPVFLDLYYRAVDNLNGQVATKERTFRDIINRLHQRDVFQKKMDEQQRKLELFQKKEQEKKDKLDKRNQLAAQKAQERAEAEAERNRKKSEEQDRKEQDKLQKQLQQAQQKALLANPPPPSSAASDQLEATAQAFLKKWIGKTRHQMSLFDNTSSQRLQIFEVAGEMRKTVDQIMDHLEKDLDVNEVAPMIDKANRQLTSIRSLTRNLHNTHRPQPKGK